MRAGVEKLLEFGPERDVAAAGLVEEGAPPRGVGQTSSGLEQAFFEFKRGIHRTSLSELCVKRTRKPTMQISKIQNSNPRKIPGFKIKGWDLCCRSFRRRRSA